MVCVDEAYYEWKMKYWCVCNSWFLADCKQPPEWWWIVSKRVETQVFFAGQKRIGGGKKMKISNQFLHSLPFLEHVLYSSHIDLFIRDVHAKQNDKELGK